MQSVFPTLIVPAEEGRYATVPALRELMRHDDRFTWTKLRLSDAACSLEVLVRRRGALLAEGADAPAETTSVLEADSIPQYVWPAAASMQNWIAAHKNLFAGKTVLELGCGTGAVGLVVAQYATRVVLTDCSAVSLAMAVESVMHNNLTNCAVAALSWGNEAHLALIKEACGINGFDVVIGSDVFYFNSSLRSGLATARSAFGPCNDKAVFLCGSVARSDRMETDLEEIPIQEGFRLADFSAAGPFHFYCWKIASLDERE